MDLRIVSGSLLIIAVAVIHTAEGTYADDVKSLFSKLFPEQNNVCRETAMAKMSGDTSNKGWAIALINLYTQDCETYLGEEQSIPFYMELNAQLRNGKIIPGSAMDKSANLLNKGLDIIGLQNHATVYRGCYCSKSPSTGTTFSFKQFASTSTKAEKASEFSEGYFFVIKKAIGVRTAKYSEYPREAEVLLKSTAQFTVTESISDANEIKSRLDSLGVSPEEQPTHYIVLRQTKARKRRSLRNSDTSCDCSKQDGATSKSTILVAPLYALVNVLIGFLVVNLK